MAQAQKTLILFTDGKGNFGDKAAQLNQALSGALYQGLRAGFFDGALGDIIALPLQNYPQYDRVIAVGLGDTRQLDVLNLRELGESLNQKLQNLGVAQADLVIDSVKGNPLSENEFACALMEGYTEANYRFDRYKSENTSRAAKLTLWLNDEAGFKQAFNEVSKLNESVALVKQLVNEPANVIYPESFVALAQQALKGLPVELEILDEKAIKAKGLNLLDAVGRGSARPPRLLVIKYTGAAANQPAMAFVGKGITFDSGGISIKPSQGMGMMKMDMAGAAAVLGALQAIAGNGLKANVIGVCALAENMPDGNAYRPGDIFTSLSGKTVEIENTDAEGRLVLADAITYVQRTYNPGVVIDIATLTGGAKSIGGTEYAPFMSNDEALVKLLESASVDTGEKLIRVALAKGVHPAVKSKVADLTNLPSGPSTAMGGEFLKVFVEKNRPWAHLDIAYTSFKDVFATGYGVRLFYRLVRDSFKTIALDLETRQPGQLETPRKPNPLSAPENHL